MAALQGSVHNNTSLIQFYDLANQSCWPSGLGVGTNIQDVRAAASANPSGARLAGVFSGTFFNDTTGVGIEFNGVSQILGFNNTSACSSTITAEMWVCLPGSPGGTFFQATDNAASLGAGVWLSTDSNRAVNYGVMYGGSSASVSSLKYLGIGTWHHVVVTAQQGGSTLLYVDGELGSGTVTQYVASAGGNSTYHAVGGGYSGYSKIRVGYYKFYSRVLTADEILQNYNATQSRFKNKALALIPAGSTGYGVAQYGNSPNATVFSTTDSGVTWTQVGTRSGESYIGRSEYNSFIVLPRSGSTGAGIYDNTLSSFQAWGQQVMRTGKSDRGPVGTLVARNFGSSLYRSTNGGSSFTLVQSSVGSFFSGGLHYGNGVWFFAALDTSVSPRRWDYLVSFDDGLTWHRGLCTGLPLTGGSLGSGFSTYTNNLHHFWSQDFATLYVSPNGINWTARGSVSGITYGDNYGDRNSIWYRNGYYYGGSGGGTIVRSTDGCTFSSFGTTSPDSDAASGPGYINGNWVYPKYSGNVAKIYSSSDATPSTWTLRYTSPDIGSTYYGGTAMGINQHGPAP